MGAQGVEQQLVQRATFRQARLMQAPCAGGKRARRMQRAVETVLHLLGVGFGDLLQVILRQLPLLLTRLAAQQADGQDKTERNRKHAGDQHQRAGAHFALCGK